MSFDLAYNKRTGQIVRFGYDLNPLANEAVLSFDGWTEFSDKAIDTKKKILIPATDKTRYSYVPGPEQLWNEILEKRNFLLSSTDYLMMPDYPISAETRTNLSMYRQALRDITKQSDPSAIVWPEEPTK